MRRYSDPIEVKSQGRPEVRPDGQANEPTDGATNVLEDPPPPPPQAFVWRGRLYVVRQVIGHWRERRAWWHEALDPDPGQPVGIDIASREQQVWRVEASPGRARGSGVFDLVHDDVPHAGQTDWRLVRVAD